MITQKKGQQVQTTLLRRGDPSHRAAKTTLKMIPLQQLLQRLVLLWFLMLLSTTITTYGFPSGAGSCVAGNRSPLGHPDDALKGTLTDGNFQMTINSDTFKEGVIQTIELNQDHTITIQGLDESTIYRGFLLRIASTDVDNIDMTGTLDNPTDNPDFQIRLNADQTDTKILQFCDSEVAVATHRAQQGKTNAYDKNLITDIIWNIPSNQVVQTPDNTEGTIDVEATVLVKYNTYYYSKYTVKVIGDGHDDDNDSSARRTRSFSSITSMIMMLMMMILLF